MNNFLINSTLHDWTNAFDNLFKPILYDEKFDYMKTDITESDHGYDLEIEMPGFTKEDISISLENQYLTVSAQRNKTSNPQSKYLRKERSIQCSRSFYVADIKESDIKASYNNGVLTINLPKEEPEKPQKRNIVIE